ncbi:MAG: hypothetical protein R2785_01965 [Flavobacteriaceae bacterium]
MNLIKKIATVSLFVFLILSFIGYRIGFFEKIPAPTNSELIANNFLARSVDSLNLEKRLSIDYETFILIDTLNVKATKTVYKTLSLKTRPHMFSSSKSMPVYENYAIRRGPPTKDKEIIEKLKTLKIIHVYVSSNGAFDMLRRDADLIEAITLIEQKKLTKDSDVRYSIKYPEDINYFWNQINNVVQISFGDEELYMVKKNHALEFLNWFEKYDLLRTTPIFSSSKSMVIPDSEKIFNEAKEQLQEDRKILKEKIKEHLNIEF